MCWSPPPPRAPRLRSKKATIARNSPAFTAPYDVTGIPALSIPCGFDRNGLPIGLMLGGRHFDESTICRVAHTYEQSTDWCRMRPEV